ncbi:hypothetical protein [Actinoallomurus sp. NPDC052274]|uniref:hypothetical protein n=1 Tax=Actinoallomurus sp. NPDC052274 TaxID=3155420 RepID=UPI003433DEED
MTPIRRILVAGLAGAAAVVALSAPASASPAGTVHADSTIHWNIVKGVRSYGCYAAMDAEKSKGKWYVRGRYYRYAGASTCYFALVRKSSHSSYSWHYQDKGQGVWVYGGWHKDSGYKSHSCATTDTLNTKCTKSW